MTRVSVAVPLFNEERTAPALLDRLAAVLGSIPGGPHEMVLVDDGSSDGTLAVLEGHDTPGCERIIVSLSRNFGHQAAISAALDHVGGDVVVVMDGDLQDAPEAIPTFLARFHEGYEVVYARRVSRKESLLMRGCYSLFYRGLARLSNVPLPVDAGDFGLMSRRVVNAIRESPEHHRYLRGLRAWVGYRQIGVDVERAARGAGQSKYGWNQLLRLAFDGLFAFSLVPLRLATVTGLLALMLALAFAAYAVYARLFLARSPQGFTALLIIIIFLAGIHLVFLGVIGEYVGRIYEQSKGRPLYLTARISKYRTDRASPE